MTTLEQLPQCDPETATSTLAALRQASAKFSMISNEVSHRLASLNQSLPSVAMAVAKAALLSDQDLVNERTKRFVQACLEFEDSEAVTRIAIHPDCIPALQEYLSSIERESIQIQSDPQLVPGDCRIDNGQTGLIATLDSCLYAVMQQVVSASGERS